MWLDLRGQTCWHNSAKVLLAETAYVPPPQQGNDVDVDVGEEEGDAEERCEGVSDPTPGFFLLMKVVIFRCDS